MDISNKILSDITVYMKYAKYLPEENRRETWEELVTRNKNMHIKRYPELRDQIEENYKLVYDKKVLPSMRSLQFGGKPIEISPNRIYNCAYLPIDHPDSFAETMFLLLGGTGVGYSVHGAVSESGQEFAGSGVLRGVREPADGFFAQCTGMVDRAACG